MGDIAWHNLRYFSDADECSGMGNGKKGLGAISANFSEITTKDRSVKKPRMKR